MEQTRKKNREKLRYMTVLALLIAIIALLQFTPLGYLKVGPIEITFLTIPVAIGAITLGPAAGAILGGVFGATSFIQCFGFSAFGVILLDLNPVFAFLVCVPTRILCGLLCGLVFRALKKHGNGISAYIVGALSCPLLNSVLYISALLAFYSGYGILAGLITLLLLVNVAVEAVACTAIGAAVTRALSHVIEKRQ